MSAKSIDKLEAQLQALIEGAFTRFIRRAFSSRDIAILLLRAMERNACPASANGEKPIAPDAYAIVLEPETAERFLASYPDLPARLAGLIAELSAESGYQLLAAPSVSVLADRQLESRQVRISAEHSRASSAKTEKMASLAPETTAPSPAQSAHLHIVGVGAVPLSKAVITVGRDSDNDVVISDAFVSRHHLQLRQRAGVYTVYDSESRGGLTVNNIAVRQHRLQNGDVIRIGRTNLIYAEAYRQVLASGATQVLSQE